MCKANNLNAFNQRKMLQLLDSTVTEEAEIKSVLRRCRIRFASPLLFVQIHRFCSREERVFCQTKGLPPLSYTISRPTAAALSWKPRVLSTKAKNKRKIRLPPDTVTGAGSCASLSVSLFRGAVRRGRTPSTTTNEAPQKLHSRRDAR